MLQRENDGERACWSTSIRDASEHPCVIRAVNFEYGAIRVQSVVDTPLSVFIGPPARLHHPAFDERTNPILHAVPVHTRRDAIPALYIDGTKDVAHEGSFEGWGMRGEGQDFLNATGTDDKPTFSLCTFILLSLRVPVPAES